MSDGATHSAQIPFGVLICDDNEIIRALIWEAIETRSALVVVGEAGDGNAAVVEATRLQPDVILLDLAMPGRTGLEIIPELCRVVPGSKIIVFSGFVAASFAPRVLELGAVRYLMKGEHLDTILDTIEEVAASNERSRT